METFMKLCTRKTNNFWEINFAVRYKAQLLTAKYGLIL